MKLPLSTDQQLAVRNLQVKSLTLTNQKSNAEQVIKNCDTELTTTNQALLSLIVGYVKEQGLDPQTTKFDLEALELITPDDPSTDQATPAATDAPSSTNA